VFSTQYFASTGSRPILRRWLLLCVMKGHVPAVESPGKKRSGKKRQRILEGDWWCPRCGDLQFARNEACRRCQAPRPQFPNSNLIPVEAPFPALAPRLQQQGADAKTEKLPRAPRPTVEPAWKTRDRNNEEQANVRGTDERRRSPGRGRGSRQGSRKRSRQRSRHRSPSLDESESMSESEARSRSSRRARTTNDAGRLGGLHLPGPSQWQVAEDTPEELADAIQEVGCQLISLGRRLRAALGARRPR